jgi:rubredoxin
MNVLEFDAPDTLATSPWRTWICMVCGFVYAEEFGLPEDGIAAGTRWEDIPDEWVCSDCGVGKADFEPAFA